MKKFQSRLLIAVSMIVLSAPLQAGVIWDNGSSTANTGGNCSDCGNGSWKVFDDFTFGGDTTIGGVTWDSAFSGDIDLFDISVQFWTGLNTGLIETQTYTIGSSSAVSYTNNTPVNGGTNYTVEIDLSDLTLSAGTYYVSIQGTLTGGYMAFANASSGQGSNAHQLLGSSGAIYNRGYDMPFRLLGATEVPAPATLAIFGLALLGLARVRSKA